MIVQQSSPQIRKRDSLWMRYLDVIIALIPVIIMSIISFGFLVLRNIAISIVTMELSELVFFAIKHKMPYDGEKHTFKEHFISIKKSLTVNTFLAPLVSALIFTSIMPIDINPKGMIYVALITGSLFGEIIGKLVFGGTGKNIFNPAAIGMVFAKICFGNNFLYPNSSLVSQDVVAGATPLVGDYNSYSILDLLLGKAPGVIGETCRIAILAGLIYLIIRRTIDWRIPLSYLGVFLVDMFFVGLIKMGKDPSINPFQFSLYQLLSGGILFASVFMVNDPVTSPTTTPGKIMYGSISAAITIIIRLFASMPDGVIYAVLLGNIATCVLDYYKWARTKFNWKNILAINLIIIIPLLIIIWATAAGNK